MYVMLCNVTFCIMSQYVTFVKLISIFMLLSI
nr:MAG TPA: hypothetical protein [Caudoviricetes sp.]